MQFFQDLMLLILLQSFPSTAIPTLNLTTSWTPNPVDPDFTIHHFLHNPHANPYLTTPPLLISALKTAVRLAKRPYTDPMRNQIFPRVRGSQTQLRARTRYGTTPREFQVRHAMWALGLCGRWFERQRVPSVPEAGSFNCEMHYRHEGEPFGVLIWEIVAAALEGDDAEGSSGVGAGYTNNNASTTAFINYRRRSLVDMAASEVRSQPRLATRRAIDGTDKNTTSTAISPPNPNNEDNEDGISPLKYDTDSETNSTPRVAVKCRHWGKPIGIEAIYDAFLVAMADRASKPNRGETVRGAYTFRHQDTSLEIVYQPRREVAGDALAYKTIVEALGTVPRYMAIAGDKYRECDFWIYEDDVIVGDGSVRVIV